MTTGGSELTDAGNYHRKGLGPVAQARIGILAPVASPAFDGLSLGEQRQRSTQAGDLGRIETAQQPALHEPDVPLSLRLA